MTNLEKIERFRPYVIQLTRGLEPIQIDFNGVQKSGFEGWLVWFVGEDAELAALRLADHYDNVVVENVRFEGSKRKLAWRVRTV